MLQMDPKQKKRIVSRRILREVTAYYFTHQQGIGMKVLSAKYAVALNLCGGFPECIDEMVRAGELRVEIVRLTGARLVFPGDGAIIDHVIDDPANYY